MLAKMEVAYLGILRVFLLVMATIALLVTVAAAVTALPALGGIFGSHGQVRGASLKDFVDANSENDVSDMVVDDEFDTAPRSLTGDQKDAAKGLARYDTRNGGEQRTQKFWDDLVLSAVSNDMPASLIDDYSADLLHLTEQLAKSKGRPLSDDRLAQLLQYHRSTFLENAAASEANRAAGLTSSMGKLAVAGISFLIFVLVLFNFIFVKIERNLRGARVEVDQ